MSALKNDPSNQSDLRQQAEQFLQSEDDDQIRSQDLTGDEARRLVHELRVHQIELEMQNEALQESRIALERSQAKYFDLYELAPVGYFTVSDKGIILEANLTGASMLRTNRSQLIGRGMGSLIAGPYQDHYYAQRNQLLRGHAAPACQVQMLRATGFPLFVQLDSLVVNPHPEDPQPSAITFRIALTDVSDEVAIKMSLREANAGLETALVQLKASQKARHEQEQFATLGQMAAGIAHEFNNMLAAILLLTQLSLRGIMGASAEKQIKIHDNLKLVEAETLRATNMVRSILDFSQQAILQKSALDLVTFLGDLTRSLQSTLPPTIHCTFTTQAEDAVIWADADRLRQGIVNVITNAQHAMPNGGDLHLELTQFTVTLPTQAPIPGMKTGTWFRITATDTGQGMTAETLAHLYEPFFTTRSPLGTGLGLAQLQGTIIQQNGHVQITSQPGQGTLVTLYLPAADLAHPDAG